VEYTVPNKWVDHTKILDAAIQHITQNGDYVQAYRFAGGNNQYWAQTATNV
jgi:hypothetical protein